MAIDSILQHPHLALRRKARSVKRVGKRLRRTIDRMFRLMHRHGGIGLAANQVGLARRLFVMRPQIGPSRVFVNPVIVQQRGSAIDQEGCLSLPGVKVSVPRSSEITVEAMDYGGEKFTQVLWGRDARVVQHEIDHLNGVLIIDYCYDPLGDEPGLLT